MTGQGHLFLDIDREPERQSARPAGVGSAPATQTASARHATEPTAQELAASLAELRASTSTSRPISLAAALAEIRPTPSTPADTMAAQTPAPLGARSLTTPLWELDTHELAQRAQGASSSARVNGDPTNGAFPADDAYLDRAYDFTRPEVVSLFDRTVVPLWSVPFGRMLLTAFQASRRHPGWQVVDVACGTGYPTLELARLLGSDGDVAGIDLWQAGIERARKKAEAQQLKNVAFLVADIAECDLPERSFDAAICNLGLTNFPHPEAALRGIARLLQPNAPLFLTTNLQGTMLEFFELYHTVLRDLGLVELSLRVEQLVSMQPTLEAVVALLERVGFSIDQATSDQFALEFPDGSTFLRSHLIGMCSLKSWRKVVSDLALRQVIFNELERRLNARAVAWRRLDLTVPMLCLTARRREKE